MRHCCFVIFLFLINLHGLSADDSRFESRLRRPVAMDASPDHKWLYVANRDSGTVSLIDVVNRSVVAEIDVGGRLSDIAVLDDLHLVVADSLNHQLVLLKRVELDWEVSQRLDVARHPVRIVVNRRTSRCFVTSLWSRSVTGVKLSETDQDHSLTLEHSRSEALAFEPLEVCLTADDQHLLVFGAFKNSLAVIDTVNLKTVSTKQLSGHNVRGVALSSDEKSLFIAHQLLNPLGQSTQDDVHWGNMISNVLVRYSVDELIESDSGVMSRRVVRHLGEPGNAAGDPGFVNIGPNGVLAVALAGVSEVAISNSTKRYRPQRLAVGRRPSAIHQLADGTLFVASMFSDSVSVINSKELTLLTKISLGPQPELSPEQLGEALFYDSRLSHDGWMSCHSCHTDGHTNGLLNDNLSDGNFGEPKRVLSLLGVADTGPWAWNGQVKTLEEQVKNSIEQTMQGTLPETKDVRALVAYLRSLSAPPASVVTASNADVSTGTALFESLECSRCHTPPSYTSAGTYDVAIGNGEYSPPSLRGVGRHATLFHDSRADSLHSVLIRHKHQLPRDLSEEEVADLVQFLKTL